MVGRNGVEKISDGRFCQRHCHAMPADDRWRNHTICAGADQLAFRSFFGGASDDVNIRIEIARSQNYVDVIRVVWKTRRYPARVLDTCFDQTLFERRIPDEHRDAGVHQCFDLTLIALDHEKDAVYGAQASYQMRSDAPRAADDKMVSQFAHFS